jgi:tetrahydromethanopterin S-methyltransferase subunit G
MTWWREPGWWSLALMLITMTGGYATGFFSDVQKFAHRLEDVEVRVQVLQNEAAVESKKQLEWGIQFDNRLDEVERDAARAAEWWKSADSRLERIERKLDSLRR